jgi:hypothetical protein
VWSRLKLVKDKVKNLTLENIKYRADTGTGTPKGLVDVHQIERIVSAVDSNSRR